MSDFKNWKETVWCSGGSELVRVLSETFGKENVLVRSPYHVQVKQERSLHNIWIDSLNTVKYKLADQAGVAEVAETSAQLLRAIGGHDHNGTDLASMRQALELSQLIHSAKAALPLYGLSRAAFVDAGIKGHRAQIAVVEVTMEVDGEHVRAESHPSSATSSHAAEEEGIRYAIGWASEDVLIFCDNQSAVNRARTRYGDRIRWLPRDHNKAADGVANLRGNKPARNKNRRRKRKRRGNAK